MNAWQKKTAQQFDGHAGAGPAPSTAGEREYLADIAYLRQGAQTVSPAPEIADAQFSAFMLGIREGIEAPAPRRGFWAALSLVTAALVAAISLFVIFETNNIVQPPTVSAVESATTDISGATVTSGTAEDGTAVVWVDAGQVEMWE
ncbi:MAG: hypothetical protein SGI88_22425 [Candidatus Hydrogenedentes bacterium]|nr:hypothetical protein [Candidatus Hydrogenedentota bacterium]